MFVAAAQIYSVKGPRAVREQMVQEGHKRDRDEPVPAEVLNARPRTPPPALAVIPEEELEEELVGPVLPQPKKRKVGKPNGPSAIDTGIISVHGICGHWLICK